MKRRAVTGTAWVTGGYGTSQMVRLVSNVLLAWLLFPEAFGLMALVLVVTAALEMFSSVGLDAAVVKNRRGDEPGFLNVVWTMQIIRGVLLWCVAALAAPWAAGLYDQPRLAELIPVAAAVCIFKGAWSTKFLWNKRHLRYGRNTAVELISQTTGMAVMLLLAWLWRDVWALVFGMVVAAAARMALTHLLLPGPTNRLAWDLPTVLELLAFGKWLFVSTVMTFFANQLDKLLLALLVPAGVLGVYHIAVSLALLPVHVVTRIAESVLFPALARHHDASPETLVDKVRLARRAVLLAAVFIVLGLVLLAPLFFRSLYPAEYHDAAWMTQVYCLAVWFTTLTVTGARSLLARGVTWVFAAHNGANAAMTLVGCLVGYELLGVPGFILGFGFGTLCGYLVVQGAMWRHGMSTARQDAAFTGLLIVLVGAGLAGQWAVAGVAEGYAGLALELAAALLLLGAYGLWAGDAVLDILLGARWQQVRQRLDAWVSSRSAAVVPRRHRGG